VTRFSLTALLVGCSLGIALHLRRTVVRPLQTLANLLNALKHEDYSIDARGAARNDPLGLVLHEANTLRALLRERRLGAIEASALLRTVIEERTLDRVLECALGNLRAHGGSVSSFSSCRC
jgi:two-component system, NtrC family, nitrogen regulation sensor histidine kinase NtrY